MDTKGKLHGVIQTNNRAELQACIEAMRQFLQSEVKSLEIFTDSIYVLKGVTVWYPRWIKLGLEKANMDLFGILYGLTTQAKELQRLVRFTWTAGHQGKNIIADKLARAAAGYTSKKRKRKSASNVPKKRKH